MLNEINKINENKRQLNRKKTVQKIINLDYNNQKSKFFKSHKRRRTKTKNQNKKNK